MAVAMTCCLSLESGAEFTGATPEDCAEKDAGYLSVAGEFLQ
jgi:hypothetical protein